MTNFVHYDLAQARQRELRHEAEVDRLAAEMSRQHGSRRDALLMRVGNLLMAAGARVARRAERSAELPREATAGAR